jgi:hypothetical protein
VQGAEKVRLLKERFRVEKNRDAFEKEAVSVDEQKNASGEGDLFCVFVEGSREELADVLKDVQNQRDFQQAHLTNTISAEKLAQYANSLEVPAVRAGKQSSARSQTVLSLPSATVGKILADNESASDSKAVDRDKLADQKTVQSKAVTPGFTDVEGVASKNVTKNGAARNSVTSNTATQAQQNGSKDDLKKNLASTSLGYAYSQEQAPAQRVPAGQPRSAARVNRQQVAAATQRSYQVFFVIEDQAAAPPETAKQAPAVPVPAPASATSPTVAKGRAPVVAQPPAKRPTSTKTAY